MAKVVEKPVPVDEKTGRALGQLLIDYDWTSGSASACMFEPVVAFRFRRGAEAAVVEICFKCGEKVIDGVDGPLGGKQRLSDRERRAWLQAAKRAFPRKFDGFEDAPLDIKTKDR
jgi:hypothetical protein